MMIAVALLAPVALNCVVVDGDTLRCGPERVRLIGIDAPELGRCPRHRKCAPGDGPAARRSLSRLAAGKPLTIERRGRDRYGRTLAFVSVAGRDLSCALLRAGQAVYRADWDPQRRLARRCRFAS